MVSRFIFISAAVLLLATATFAEKPANPLVNENGDSVQFLPGKRDFLSGLLQNAHEKQAVAPPPVNTAPNPSKQQPPLQGNAGTQPTPKQEEPDEQAGDVVDAGDDKPDLPGAPEAKKRSLDFPSNSKYIAPGSVTEPFARRQAVQPQLEVEDDDIEDDDEEDIEDAANRETKRNLRAHIRGIVKRDIDRFIKKTQIGVDGIINKTSKFADKVGGGSDDSTNSSGLPDGHSEDTTKKANEAIEHAKTLSSASKQGDVKAISNAH